MSGEPINLGSILSLSTAHGVALFCIVMVDRSMTFDGIDSAGVFVSDSFQLHVALDSTDPGDGFILFRLRY
jgi:hypothetical protein